jgi:hypothetical protein
VDIITHCVEVDIHGRYGVKCMVRKQRLDRESERHATICSRHLLVHNAARACMRDACGPHATHLQLATRANRCACLVLPPPPAPIRSFFFGRTEGEESMRKPIAGTILFAAQSS